MLKAGILKVRLALKLNAKAAATLQRRNLKTQLYCVTIIRMTGDYCGRNILMRVPSKLNKIAIVQGQK